MPLAGEGQMSWDQAVNNLKPKLLTMVDKLAKNREFQKVIPERPDSVSDKFLGTNQWRRLVAAAREATTMGELKALIRYKVGKSSRDSGWAAAMENEGTVGFAIVNELTKIEKLAETQGLGEQTTEQLALRATALYFGYLTWKVVSSRV